MLFKKIKPQELVDFTKNLSVMLRSGITIDEALDDLSDQTTTRSFKKILLRVKEELEAGTSLSEAFRKEEKAFGGVFLSIVRAGESSGTLEDNLTFLADWLEHNTDIKKEVKAAMMYPKIVFTATIAMGGGLAVFILPKLLPLFTSLDVALPLPTVILLAVTTFVQSYWLLTLVLVFALGVALSLLAKIYFFKRIFHGMYIRMPIFGSLIVDYQLTLISQLFSTLFRGGLSIYEALDVAAEGATNVRYQEALHTIGDHIMKGTSLSEAMREHERLFPKSFISIVAVGERSGTIEESFRHLSSYYTKEVKNKTKKLPNVIEPVLLLFIGLVVGFIAVAIIMPIYQLTSGVNR